MTATNTENKLFYNIGPISVSSQNTSDTLPHGLPLAVQ